jgi:hypothetical protein
VGLADDWFDQERTSADIPPNALKLLSPLVRGSVAPAPQRADTAEPATPRNRSRAPSTPTQSPSAATPGAAPSPALADKPQSWPASGTKVDRLRQMTQDPAGTPGRPGAAGAPAVPAAVSRPGPEQQRGDAPTVGHAALAEHGLPPIAEALIRTLAQKASSGALTEEKAFELLGDVRAL